MTTKKRPVKTREALPHVEILREPTGENLPVLARQTQKPAANAFASVGKIPGELHDVPVGTRKTIRAAFLEIGIENLGSSEIQRNGKEAGLDDVVESGDTVLAISKIRGN